MAIWGRKEDLTGLVHHSDMGVQYLSIRYTERLEEEKAVVSVGSRGDSYDNALAETINGLYKSELIYNEHEGPWRTVEDVEWPRSPGCTGGITSGSWSPSVTCRRPSSRPTGGKRSKTGRSAPL